MIAEAVSYTDPSVEGVKAVEQKSVSGDARPEPAEKPAEEKPKPEVPESYQFPEDLKLTEEEKT